MNKPMTPYKRYNNGVTHI